jgi:hypothetical protein
MLPTADRWTMIVSKEASGFHNLYNPQADLGRVTVATRRLETPVEQLTFAITPNPSSAGGTITMTWETTAVSAPFTTNQ